MKGVSPSTSLSAPKVWIPERRGRRNQTQRKRGWSAAITAQIDLRPPPYPLNGLEPHMSKHTLELHWGRHHRGHVDSLNRQIAGTQLDGMGLEDLLAASYNNGDPLPSFHHAAQIWNHDFFWHSIKPDGGGRPSGDLLYLIERDFGSFDRMLMEFKRAAVTQFGSGWAWLLYKANRLNVGNAVNPCPSEMDNKLVVAKTPNAVNPLVWDYTPLLALDVWEHAYYLDHENRRADYVSVFMEKLISWEVVSSRLEMAIARAAERTGEGDVGEQEEETIIGDPEAMEMYLDSENEDSEVE